MSKIFFMHLKFCYSCSFFELKIQRFNMHCVKNNEFTLSSSISFTAKSFKWSTDAVRERISLKRFVKVSNVWKRRSSCSRRFSNERIVSIIWRIERFLIENKKTFISNNNFLYLWWISSEIFFVLNVNSSQRRFNPSWWICWRSTIDFSRLTSWESSWRRSSNW